MIPTDFRLREAKELGYSFIEWNLAEDGRPNSSLLVKTDIARLWAVSGDLRDACKRLLYAIEADTERLPSMDIKTSWEINGQAIAQIRVALAEAEPLQGAAP